MQATQISKAEAYKAFRGAGIKVQTATPVKVKGEDGVERDAMQVENAPLAEAHVLSAAKREDGTVVIVTLDGKRHEARGQAKAD